MLQQSAKELLLWGLCCRLSWWHSLMVSYCGSCIGSEGKPHPFHVGLIVPSSSWYIHFPFPKPSLLPLVGGVSVTARMDNANGFNSLVSCCLAKAPKSVHIPSPKPLYFSSTKQPVLYASLLPLWGCPLPVDFVTWATLAWPSTVFTLLSASVRSIMPGLVL